jgi:hypothetical protein
VRLQCGVEETAEAANGRVLFGGVLTARGRDSGADTQLRFWTVNWTANGQVTRRKGFRDRDAALEAAELSE